MAGAQFVSLGGAVALTVPVPATPVVSHVAQWNGQLQEVASRSRYRRPVYRGNYQYYQHRHYRYRRHG